MTLEEALCKILQDSPHRIVLSQPRAEEKPYIRTEIVLKEEGRRFYQEAKRTATQVFHKNYEPAELSLRLHDLLPARYAQLNAWSDTREYSIRLSKKNKVLFHETLSKGAVMLSLSHNRPKNHILAQDTVIPALVDMGIFTKEGRLIPSMSDKYKQINRFVELVDDAVRDLSPRPLRIIDFGCGKSYLTFILYHYFTQIRKLPIEMLGLDLKADVIAHCNATAKRYGYDHLRFQVGDIHGFREETNVDMVITLHACDTATDFALQNAVACGASMIFSVPCCQHELNRQIQSDDFSILTRYGIVKERISALMTDTIRANYLITKGYKTQLLEFVELEHTPKNLLIRAIKAPLSEKVKQTAAEEIQRLCEEFHFHPSILQEGNS